MKRIALLFVLVWTFVAHSASSVWDASVICDLDSESGDGYYYLLGTLLKDAYTGLASIDTKLFGYRNEGRFYLKQYDQNTTPVGGYNVTWAISRYGQLVSKETIADSSVLPLCVWDTHDHEGGLLVEDATDFYLAFESPASGSIDGIARYGWMHLLVDDEYEMRMLGSGIGMVGENVLVGNGQIPEPSTALLLLIGCAGLCLRRQPH